MITAFSRAMSILLVAGMASSAGAEPPGLTPIDTASVNHDYRGAIVAADAASVLLTGLALHADDPYMLIDGFALGVITGPTVHLFEHNGRGALRSLGLRVGLPLLGSWIGARFRDPPGDPKCTDACSLGHAGQGFAVGVLAAISIDWFAFAHVERRRATWSPAVAPTTDRAGAVVSVAGAF